MRYINLKKLPLLMLLILTMLFAGATIGRAKNYVSLQGGFYIELPGNWQQLDYNVVDALLRYNQADNASLEYDAAFAQIDSLDVLDGNYMILEVDTVGTLSKSQIDSVLAELSQVFGKDVSHAPVADLILNLKSNAPSYDEQAGLVTVQSDIAQPGKPARKSLLIMKFYEKGIASFYFNSPNSLFEESRKSLFEIVKSLSTENIETALPAEKLKITDVSADEDGSTRSSSLPILYGAVTVMLVLVIIMRRRRRSRT